MLFADTAEIAMEAYLSTHKIKNSSYHFDQIYEQTHFIPLNEYCTRYLRFFTVEDWHDIIKKNIFETDEPPKIMHYGYDIYKDGAFLLVWLDGDLHRLWIASQLEENLYVYCFAWQKDFVRKFLGDDVEILIANFDKVEEILLEYL